MLELLRYMNAIHPLSAETQALLAIILKEHVVLKGRHWLKQGEVCERIAFIQRGLFRIYFDSGSKDASLWYNRENEVTISVHSFFTQTPSAFSIQAIEDTSVLYITHNQLQELYARYPEFNINGRRILEHYYSISEMHVRLLMSPTILRFEIIQQLYPWLMEDERITNKMLAAYIGISPEHLSRFQNRRRQDLKK